ncbi:50S ribosomal protein L24 [Patescibacteria group bacterium]|nr:50S ribosomal protein L24 [Patescibacteria group bacterium]MBU2633407.1 50S ribosomal protein L24 [Patescibacteria group bacterium]
MKLKKGDKVFVVSGKDKGKTGKITKSLPDLCKVVVEGINIRKKHTRPKKEGQKGQVVQIPAPMDVSNVRLVCEKCGKAVRIGYKILEDGKKVRTCKKCQEEV